MTTSRKATVKAQLWGGSEAREMARADGYVMARRPRCIPFVVSAKEWDAVPESLHITLVQPARRGK